MTRTFDEQNQQRIYDRYMEISDRPSGSALASAYKRGIDGKPPMALRTSLAYAAWAAGRDKFTAG